MLNDKISLIINSESQEKGNLYVGGYDSLKLISKYNIDAVLSVIWIQKLKSNTNVKHLIIAADDSPTYKMSQHFEQAVEFIQENLQTTNVLVHCAMGISRSVCLIRHNQIKIEFKSKIKKKSDKKIDLLYCNRLYDQNLKSKSLRNFSQNKGDQTISRTK